MTCKCGSNKIVSVSGKVSDLCSVRQGDLEHTGHVPSGLNIGRGDYLNFKFCPDCGTLQGNFPINVAEVIEEYS